MNIENNGKIFDIEKISDKKTAAKIWSEGDVYLNNLLLYLWSKGIKTRACCAHKKYIMIQLESLDNNLGGIFELAQSNTAEVKFGFLHIDFKGEKSDNFSLSIHENRDNKYDNFFDQVLKCFQKEANFISQLKKYNKNGFMVFRDIAKLNGKPFLNTQGVSRLDFVCFDNQFGYIKPLRYDYVPINRHNKETIKSILASIKQRNDFLEDKNTKVELK